MRSKIIISIPMVEGPMRRIALGATAILRQSWSGQVNLLSQLVDWSTCQLEEIAGAVVFLKPTTLPSIPLPFPLVNVGYHYLDIPFPSVACDPVVIGRLAADSLASLPVERWAVLSDPIPEINARCEACLQQWSARGFVGERWELSQVLDSAILAQLCGHAGRIALYAGSDRRAESVLRRAQAANIPVPDRLCILATDDNEVVQCSCPVPLSSICVPATGIGQAAANLLLELISGKAPPSGPLLLAPGRVVRRVSTALPSQDPVVEMAKAFLAKSLHQQVSIEAVALHCGVARRTLENRFRRCCGCTLGEELANVRLAKACEMLEHTSRSIAEIAAAVSF